MKKQLLILTALIGLSLGVKAQTKPDNVGSLITIDTVERKVKFIRTTITTNRFIPFKVGDTVAVKVFQSAFTLPLGDDDEFLYKGYGVKGISINGKDYYIIEHLGKAYEIKYTYTLIK